MKRLTLVVFAALLLFSSCIKTHNQEPVCDTSYDPCALVAPAVETDSVEAYLAAKAIVATKHCSGMYYKIDTVGTGSPATACSTVTIRYKGELTNGRVFENRLDASQQLLFSLGQLIAGFKNGIPLIKEGGTIHLYIPPTLAYGNVGQGEIPPNAVLIFQVTLVTVQR